jgi:hypothetical protein
MNRQTPVSTYRRVARLLAATALLALLSPAASPAAITTFGSPLSAPATLNTAENLVFHPRQALEAEPISGHAGPG